MQKMLQAKCLNCGQDYLVGEKDGYDTAKFCSVKCYTVRDLFEANLLAPITTLPSGDPRTFFYDAPLGSLSDKWTVLCLRRVHSADIGNQQELDFQMFRIKKAIHTKLAVRAPIDEERKFVMDLCKQLLFINALGWRIRSMTMNERLPEEQRRVHAYDLIKRILPERDAIIRQLDLFGSGKTHAWKFY